jgi:hypothetical protein
MSDTRYDAAFEAGLDGRNAELTDDEWAGGPVLWVRRLEAQGWIWVRNDVRKNVELTPVTWDDIAAVVATETCEDCGGTGYDSGAVSGPEPCAMCLGGGVRIVGDEVESAVMEKRCCLGSAHAGRHLFVLSGPQGSHLCQAIGDECDPAIVPRDVEPRPVASELSTAQTIRARRRA